MPAPALPPVFAPFLKGRVALITGSTSGIGLSTAKRFAQAGADVVVHGPEANLKDASFLDELKALSKGGRAMYVGAELTDRAQIKDLVTRVTSEFGRLDNLVNNAGIQHVEDFRTFDNASWDKLIAINLTAPFLLMQHALPYMEQQKYGRIVNIASIQGLVGSKQKSAYNAAKHGLIGLTKSFTMDTAAQDITANCVCPGLTMTALMEKQLKDLADAKFKGDVDAALKAALGQRVPSLRPSYGDEMGDMCVYLCSPAAVNVKGATFVVDGGLTAA